MLVQTTIVLTGFVMLASCGSRTGLFGPLPDEEDPDASIDVRVPRDSSIDGPIDDAFVDAAVDAPIDAPIDAIEEPIGCVPGKFTFSLATPQLVFVLDRSGSMDYDLRSNSLPVLGRPTRWHALHDALEETITPFSNQISMGARFFPVANASPYDPTIACMQDPVGSAIAPNLGNAEAILEVFEQTPPIGGTPTALALQLAAQQLSSSRALARALVVATDGAPNCNAALDPDTCTCTSSCTGVTGGTNCLDDRRTIDAVAAIFDTRKIPVYVVGIGVTSSFGETLDAMAIAGGRPRAGTPRYYAADTPADLRAAFAVVRDSVSRCSYITPSSPRDADAIAVVIDGVTIPRDPRHVEGWDWIDQDFGHLQLFGSACSRASATNVSGTVECSNDR